MRKFKHILMIDLEEMNSADFRSYLRSYPKIVSVCRLESTQTSVYNWVIVLENEDTSES